MVNRTASAPTAQRFRWLAMAAAVMTFLLIIVGGIVRVTGSGLGCPDWPLCYGQLIPPMRLASLIEYSHRLTASLTSPLIVATSVVAWLRYHRSAWIFWPAVASLGLLVVQVLLGALTVLTELPPTIVAIHLGTALLILALQVLIMVGAFRVFQHGGSPPRFSMASSMARMTASTGAVVFLLLLSGAWVTSSGAASACLGWPLCTGTVWPGAFLSQIHMFHRFMAGLSGLMIIALAWIVWRDQARHPYAARAALATAGLVVVQILIGAANVLSGFPAALGGLHVAAATGVWTALLLTLALAAEGQTDSPAGH